MMFAVFVILFAVFPLTDTDIWWHLACAREWVTTWTPVREPVVNVHEYFQQVVGFIYGLGGASLLVAFKAVLWGIVFGLFLCGHSELGSESASLFKRHSGLRAGIGILLLFVFRFHFEIRPVLFSLVFLGVYWHAIPWLAEKWRESRFNAKVVACATLILAVQWLWCKCQGLYILGPIFTMLVCCMGLLEARRQKQLRVKTVVPQVVFVMLLWLMPFLHSDGLALFLYPFGLLDRLLGLTPSATLFASQIAENRSPITLLMAGENVLESVLMVVLSLVGVFVALEKLISQKAEIGVQSSKYAWLLITALLALIAERNFVLFLPVFSLCVFHCSFKVSREQRRKSSMIYFLLSAFILAFVLGVWAKSLSAYDYSMVAYQRVPVDATRWMVNHPHSGRLFNDDRAGGYLALMNSADSIYIDGRFILKTADFFERYLEYAQNPSLFVADADSLGIDRAIFPLQYYARWDALLKGLVKAPSWHLVYRDEYFAIFDKI